MHKIKELSLSGTNITVRGIVQEGFPKIATMFIYSWLVCDRGFGLFFMVERLIYDEKDR